MGSIPRQHLGYVRCTEPDKYPTGKHFNLPGHTENNMKLAVIEKCRIESSNYRKTREAQFINLFDTKRNGLNRKMWSYWFLFILNLHLVCFFVLFVYNLNFMIVNLLIAMFFLNDRFNLCLYLSRITIQYTPTPKKQKHYRGQNLLVPFQHS